MSIIIAAEAGINHGGSVEKALELITLARYAGADLVKFQARVPHLSVPKRYWNVKRETPFGRMPYLEYKELLELSSADYERIDAHCKAEGIPWFASVWDLPSVDFIAQFDPPMYKIGSPCVTDWPLVRRVLDEGKPVVLSTGMTDFETVYDLLSAIHDAAPDVPVTVCQCTSIYPCPPELLDLQVITLYKQFKRRWGYQVGWSSHEVESGPTIAAAALGATYIERHFTDDRQQWGTDQRASLDPDGFRWMVQQVRRVELAMQGQTKKVYDEEKENAKRLRLVDRLQVPEGVG